MLLPQRNSYDLNFVSSPENSLKSDSEEIEYAKTLMELYYFEMKRSLGINYFKSLSEES